MIFIFRPWFPAVLVAALALFSATGLTEESRDYAYPFDDPLVATVVGTPEAYAVAVPEGGDGAALARHFVHVAPPRPAPEVFFFQRHGVEFGLFPQDGAAPLVLLVSGTGGGFDSLIGQRLVRLLWAAGYHVLSMPNPTHTNFIVNASTTGVPGRLAADAADLHRAMQAAYGRIAEEIEVTEIHLAGFSLGATYAAFVARHDTSVPDGFGFASVLLVNPVVSLIGSLDLVDAMLDRHLERDPDAIREFIDRAYRAFAEIYVAGEPSEFSGENLYRLYQALEPSEEDLEKLIGLAFRLSAVNLAFAADVISNSHYLVPEGRKLTDTSSLTDIYLEAQRRSFGDYVEGLFLPFHLAQDPAATPESLLGQADLRAIEDYLARASHVAVLTNADDLVLRPEDLAFLERVFAGRIRIYPTGGHGGNLLQRDVAAAIAGYFAGGWQGQAAEPDAGSQGMREGL